VHARVAPVHQARVECGGDKHSATRHTPASSRCLPPPLRPCSQQRGVAARLRHARLCHSAHLHQRGARLQRRHDLLNRREHPSLRRCVACARGCVCARRGVGLLGCARACEAALGTRCRSAHNGANSAPPALQIAGVLALVLFVLSCACARSRAVFGCWAGAWRGSAPRLVADAGNAPPAPMQRLYSRCDPRHCSQHFASFVASKPSLPGVCRPNGGQRRWADGVL
jgi:hypothetical protein